MALLTLDIFLKLFFSTLTMKVTGTSRSNDPIFLSKGVRQELVEV